MIKIRIRLEKTLYPNQVKIWIKGNQCIKIKINGNIYVWNFHKYILPVLNYTYAENFYFLKIWICLKSQNKFCIWKFDLNLKKNYPLLDFVTCNKMFHRDGDSNNYDGLRNGDFRNKWLLLADQNAHADVGLGQSRSCCQKLGKNWKKISFLTKLTLHNSLFFYIIKPTKKEQLPSQLII